MSAIATSAPPPPRLPRGGTATLPSSTTNSGLLRCPVCSTRLLSHTGSLETRTGPNAILHTPRPTATDELTWETSVHAQWWVVADVDDFDNIGMSRLVESPVGPLKIVLCSNCQQGPLGMQVGDDPAVLLCADLLVQQDAKEADDAKDFAVPDGADMDQLRSMITANSLTSQFKVTFTGQRVGMMLADASDGNGVEVVAFTTDAEGSVGPAEESGMIEVNDKVMRVGDVSTRGMEFGEVLDLVIAGERPTVILFERKPSGAGEKGAVKGERVAHTEWIKNKEAAKSSETVAPPADYGAVLPSGAPEVPNAENPSGHCRVPAYQVPPAP